MRLNKLLYLLFCLMSILGGIFSSSSLYASKCSDCILRNPCEVDQFLYKEEGEEALESEEENNALCLTATECMAKEIPNKKFVPILRFGKDKPGECGICSDEEDYDQTNKICVNNTFTQSQLANKFMIELAGVIQGQNDLIDIETEEIKPTSAESDSLGQFKINVILKNEALQDHITKYHKVIEGQKINDTDIKKIYPNYSLNRLLMTKIVQGIRDKLSGSLTSGVIDANPLLKSLFDKVGNLPDEADYQPLITSNAEQNTLFNYILSKEKEALTVNGKSLERPDTFNLKTVADFLKAVISNEKMIIEIVEDEDNKDRKVKMITLIYTLGEGSPVESDFPVATNKDLIIPMFSTIPFIEDQLILFEYTNLFVTWDDIKGLKDRVVSECGDMSTPEGAKENAGKIELRLTDSEISEFKKAKELGLVALNFELKTCMPTAADIPKVLPNYYKLSASDKAKYEKGFLYREIMMAEKILKNIGNKDEYSGYMTFDPLSESDTIEGILKEKFEEIAPKEAKVKQFNGEESTTAPITRLIAYTKFQNVDSTEIKRRLKMRGLNNQDLATQGSKFTKEALGFKYILISSRQKGAYKDFQTYLNLAMSLGDSYKSMKAENVKGPSDLGMIEGDYEATSGTSKVGYGVVGVSASDKTTIESLTYEPDIVNLTQAKFKKGVLNFTTGTVEVGNIHIFKLDHKVFQQIEPQVSSIYKEGKGGRTILLKELEVFQPLSEKSVKIYAKLLKFSIRLYELLDEDHSLIDVPSSYRHGDEYHMLSLGKALKKIGITADMLDPDTVLHEITTAPTGNEEKTAIVLTQLENSKQSPVALTIIQTKGP